ncbi:MAG: PP2C family protein-serine/threonine phosphatase [Chloroflexota bacterium]
MKLKLPESLLPHADLLKTIAEVWLKTGAAHVAIWGEGQVYANWSNKLPSISSSQPTYTQISSAIRVEDEVIGHLYVFGQNDRISKKRLKLDAELIASKVKLQRSSQNGMNGSVGFAADQSEVDEKLKNLQSRAEESERSLGQVQKQFDALIQLNQYQQKSNDTLEDWLKFFRKTILDLIPSQFVFTLDDRGEDTLLLESHPVRFKDAEVVVNYLQDMESLHMDCLLNTVSELKGVPKSIHNLLYMPIYTSSEHKISVGLINRDDGQFTQNDQALLAMISKQTQAQIEHQLSQVEAMEENRLRTEMEVAFEVQNQLLPEQPPFIDKLDIYAYSRPAMHVGGDFYDFQIREDESLIFTVGDVSGKGMSSALMMGSTRQILNSKARDEAIKTPRDLLSLALRDLYEDFMRVQMFATVFAGFYNPSTQQLIYANAGHSPIIYCSADGSAQFLEADSPPLGVLSTSLALNHTLQLYPGDCLMVATDGLSEAQNDREQQYGNDRLLDVIRRTYKDGAAHIAKMLFKDIDNFAFDTPQTDDQTLVIFKVE